MAEAFKVGDTVRLKSGGPLMTVIQVDSDRIFTTWFDDKQAERKGAFPPAALDADDGMPHIA